jgi:hypothetical protein
MNQYDDLVPSPTLQTITSLKLFFFLFFQYRNLIFFTAAVAIALLGKIPAIRTCTLGGW